MKFRLAIGRKISFICSVTECCAAAGWAGRRSRDSVPAQMNKILLTLLALLMASATGLLAQTTTVETPVQPSAVRIGVRGVATAASTISHLSDIQLEFPAPAGALVKSWSVLGKPAVYTYRVDVSAVAAATATGAVGQTIHFKTYELGAIPATVLPRIDVYVNGHLAAQKTFQPVYQIASTTLRPSATLEIDSTNRAAVVANGVITWNGPWHLAFTMPARRESATGNRFILETWAENIPTITAAIPPTQAVSFPLGGVAAGSWVAVMRVNGVTILEKPFTIPEVNLHIATAVVTPRSAPAVTAFMAGGAWEVSASVLVTWLQSYAITGQEGHREGTTNTFILNATAAPANYLVPPQPVTLNYPSLGVVGAGQYTFVFKLNGTELDRKTLTLAQDPGPIATAVLTPKATPAPTAAGLVPLWSVSASSVVTWLQSYAITGQEGHREGTTNTFILNATAAPANYLVPPQPVTLTYPNLGNVPAGEYTFVFKLNGTELDRKTLTLVQEPGPIATAVVTPKATPSLTAKFVGGAWDVSASVLVTWLRSYAINGQEGHREGTTNTFVLNATAEPVDYLVAPQPVTLNYPSLGVLGAGEYTFVFKLNGTELDRKSLRLAQDPGPVATAVVTPKAVPAPTAAGLVPLWSVSASSVVTWLQSYAITGQEGHREGTTNTFILNATAVPVNYIAAPQPVTLNYPNLGVVPAGAYVFVFKVNGTELARATLSLAVEPPAPLVLTSLVPRPCATGWCADATVTVNNPGMEITGWGEPVVTGNAITAELTTVLHPYDPVLENGVIVVPPPRVLTHTYQFGALAAGTYTFSLTAEGTALGQRSFTVVTEPPPASPVFAYARLVKADAGYAAETALYLPPELVVSNWGTVVRDGQRLKVAVETAAAPPSVVATSGLRTLSPHTYALGELPAGAYVFIMTWQGHELGHAPFAVGGTPPPPPADGLQLVSVLVRPELGVQKADVAVQINTPGTVITNWGRPVRDGSLFRVSLTTGPAPVAATANGAVLGARVEKFTYDLGSLAAGSYQFAVLSGTVEIGRRPFTVQTAPPPPPPPPPAAHVAFINVTQDTAGATNAEVGVVLSKPEEDVLDWGTVTADGSVRKVNLTLGTAVVPPVEPAAGATQDAAAMAASDALALAPLADLAAVQAPNAPPLRLARHTYALGVLPAGSYTFVVCANDRECVRKAFRVGDTTSRPEAKLTAADVLAAKTTAHPFTVNFRANRGMTSVAGAPVTVTGPGGFSGTAVLKSEMQSLDPLGIMLVAEYEIAAPGEGWDAADNGIYAVSIDATKVTDLQGGTLANGALGSFRCRIWVQPPPPPPPLKADVTVSAAEGRWQAAVAFENTGGWFAAEWGTVAANANVLSARAALTKLPEGSLAPIPAAFSHTYDLGQLAPGRYLFVFKSSAGHLASAPFTVAGVEPTPLDQWKRAAFATGGWALDSVSGDAADPDGDGVNNLAEFGLGMKPQCPDIPETGAVLVGPDGARHLAMTYRRITGAEGVDVVVEVSRNLKDWFPAGDAVTQTRTLDVDGTESVCACQTAPVGAGSWPYMRVRVVRSQ